MPILPSILLPKAHPPNPIPRTRLDQLSLPGPQQRAPQLLRALTLRKLQIRPFLDDAHALAIPHLVVEILHLAPERFAFLWRVRGEDELRGGFVGKESRFLDHHPCFCRGVVVRIVSEGGGVPLPEVAVRVVRAPEVDWGIFFGVAGAADC